MISYAENIFPSALLPSCMAKFIPAFTATLTLCYYLQNLTKFNISSVIFVDFFLFKLI